MTLVPPTSHSSGGAGTVAEITSDDGSIDVTDGTGPTTDLSVVTGLPLGWTQTGDPADVDSSDADLTVRTLNAQSAVLSRTAACSGVATSPQTSGSLATIAFVSGTGLQIGLPTWDTDAELLYVPYTTDGTNNVATLKVELSPDDTTYSELTTISYAAALNLVGAVTQLLSLKVPWNWFVKLTAVHCTIGTATVVAVQD